MDSTFERLIVELGVDSSELKRARGEYKSFIRDIDRDSKAGARSQKEFNAGMAQTTAGIRKGRQATARLNSSMRVSGLTLGKFAAAGYVAYKSVQKLTQAIARQISAYASADSAQRQHVALIKATGFAAGQTAGDLERMARSIGRETLASVQEVRQAQSALLTFKNVSGDVFERTLRSAQDLASLGFGGIQQTAVQLGKALESPTKGLSALTRVGVSFTEAQKERIKQLEEENKLYEAQALLLGAVEAQAKGAGVGAAGGIAGTIDTLQEETKLLGEAFGGLITQVTPLEGVLKYFADGARKAANTLWELVVARGGEDTRPPEVRLRVLEEKWAKMDMEIREKEAAGPHGSNDFIRWMNRGVHQVDLERMRKKQMDVGDQITALSLEIDAERKALQAARDAAQAKVDAQAALDARAAEFRQQRRFQSQHETRGKIEFRQLEAAGVAEQEEKDSRKRLTLVQNEFNQKQNFKNLEKQGIADLFAAYEEDYQKRLELAGKFLEAVWEQNARIMENNKKLNDLDLTIVQDAFRKKQEFANLEKQGVEEFWALQEEDYNNRIEMFGKLHDARMHAQEKEAEANAKAREEELKAEEEFANKMLAIHERNAKAKEDHANQTRGALKAMNLEFIADIQGIGKRSLEENNAIFAGQLSIFGDAMEKMSETSESHFRTMKGLKVAMAIMSGLTAAVASYEAGATIGGPPVGAIFAGISLAATGVLIGQIAAQEYEARALGGPAMAGKTYKVNERGPELLSVAGEDFLMMGSQNGNITPANMVGTPGYRVNVINNTDTPIEEPDVSFNSQGEMNILLESVERYLTNRLTQKGNLFTRAVEAVR